MMAGVVAGAEQAEMELLRAENQRLRDEVRDSAAANAQFRVLFEHSSDAHLIFDHTRDPRLQPAAIDDAALRRQDAGAAPAPGGAVAGAPARRPPLAREERRDGSDGAPRGVHRFEWTHRRMTGEDFPVEVTLTPVSCRADRRCW
jgi:hypothetical protein